MFCPMCGTELDDGAIFCKNCGFKVKKTTTDIDKADKTDKTDKTDKNIGKGISIILLLLTIIVMAIILINAALKGKKNTVDLANYVEFEYSGKNGDGTARVHFNHTALQNDICEKTNQYYVTVGLAYDMSNDTPKVNIISESTGLSNGDVIKAEILVGPNMNSTFQMNFKGGTIEDVVSGLETEKKDNKKSEKNDSNKKPEGHKHKYIFKPNDNKSHVKSCRDNSCDFSEIEPCKFSQQGERACVCGNTYNNAISSAFFNDFYSDFAGNWINPYEGIIYTIYNDRKIEYGFLYSESYTGTIESIETTRTGYDLNIEENFVDDVNGNKPKSFVLSIKTTNVDSMIDIGDNSTLYLVKIDDSIVKDLWNRMDDVYKIYDEAFDKVNSDKPIDPIGMWFTEEYDSYNNWAESYKIVLDRNGNATCSGYRNLDTGTYKLKGNKVIISFTTCSFDEPGRGWVVVDGQSYKAEMLIKGDKAELTVKGGDLFTNLSDCMLYKASE